MQFRFLAACAGVFLAAAACQPLAGPIDAEIILNQAGPDEYELGVVTIETAQDLATGHGDHFDVVGGMKIASLEAINIIGDREAFPTFEDVRDRTREISGGSPVAPELVVENGVVRATDYDSLTYLTIFYNFERAFNFFETVVEDDSGAVASQGVVGFYGELVASSIFPVPVIGADNAAYVGLTDSWLTLRTTDTESIPLAMNDGVIVHEFGHRSFFYNVFERVEGGFDVFRDYTTQLATADDQTVRALNLLRGVDEGIADLHAVAYSRDPEFLAASVTSVPELVQQRSPEGFFATVATYSILDDRERIAETGVGCTGTEISQSGFNFYCLGTVFLRALWLGANADIEVLRNEICPAVRRALPNVGERIVAETGDDEVIDFEIEYMLEAVAQELSPSRRGLVCDGFRQKFADQINSGRVPACD